MTKPYKTIIVDDHPIITEGLQLLFSNSEDIEIVKSFKTGEALLKYDNLNKIDIILLDIFLPDINGIDLCLKIKKLHPKTIILAISSQSERSIILQMIKNGAQGYLLKSASMEEFKDCINKAASGQLAFSDEVEKIIEKTSIYDLKTVPRLTQREKEILQLLAEGKSTQEISDILFLSYLTVQTHRRNLLNKYGVRNVVELLKFAKDNGL
ncbi:MULTISPECIES: response regulator transcription factor [Chryseobacterium]|uniref:response regulator transcription factor n=1 Tax=Chryseobacterium TaxID=59732 RepID=UPI001BE62DB5|nr:MULTISPECIES: response regulator transcription factor [Chryseobacterium]MBT2619868.1 response regulator transcription factor [Chryseobacterium sp. ISL-6]